MRPFESSDSDGSYVLFLLLFFEGFCPTGFSPLFIFFDLSILCFEHFGEHTIVW